MNLLIDFGSTFTKVTAVKRQEIIGTAKAFTTIETDVRYGLETALNELNNITGKVEFSQRLAASSAGGGLKMVAVGLVPSLTAKAAQTAACSAGAKVVKTYAYELCEAEQHEIFEINPDLVLLSGGTDGGNKSVLTHNAQKLAEIDRTFSVIVAGNKSVSGKAAECLEKSGKHTVVCGNVMPEFGRLDIMPAKNAIRGLFLEKIVEAKGLGEAAKMMTGPIIPTPLAVFEAAQMLSVSLGPLAAVDVGGATTDVYSMCDGSPTLPNVVLKGLPEPVEKRTVEGDLGMRYSLDALVEAAEQRGIDSGLLAEFQKNCFKDPSFIPNPESACAEINEKLCALAVEIASERHSGRLESVYTPLGETFCQTGKDLTKVEIVIGIGGAIIHSNDPKKILQRAAGSPKPADEFLKPVNPRLMVEKCPVFAAAGLLAKVDSAFALKLMLTNIKEV